MNAFTLKMSKWGSRTFDPGGGSTDDHWSKSWDHFLTAGKFTLQTDICWRKFWSRMVVDPENVRNRPFNHEIYHGCQKHCQQQDLGWFWMKFLAHWYQSQLSWIYPRTLMSPCIFVVEKRHQKWLRLIFR
jgi:hypothetical protein